MSFSPTPESPLAGITVLELGQFIAGPFASQILADLGARVIKIERPGSGDPFRLYVTEPRIEGYGHNFLAFNRNKESVAVDLQKPEGLAVVKRLVAKADVLIENFRAGVLERLGLGYEALKSINPRLIYCAISGFSEDGPYQRSPGFRHGRAGAVGHALSLHRSGRSADARPDHRRSGDGDAGLERDARRAFGRERSGQGSKIEISMIEAAIHFMPDAFTALTESTSTCNRRRAPRIRMLSCCAAPTTSFSPSMSAGRTGSGRRFAPRSTIPASAASAVPETPQPHRQLRQADQRDASGVHETQARRMAQASRRQRRRQRRDQHHRRSGRRCRGRASRAVREAAAAGLWRYDHVAPGAAHQRRARASTEDAAAPGRAYAGRAARNSATTKPRSQR